MNPFALLALPEAFDLDFQTLEEAYFKQQRLFHPDRFIGKPPHERNTALQRSVDINDAYKTLKSPLLRAQHILAAQGLRVGTEADSVKPSQALLMETLQWREAIDDAATPETAQSLQKTLQQAQSDCLSTLAALYEEQNWPAMADSTLRLGYLEKSLEAVAQKKKRLEKA